MASGSQVQRVPREELERKGQDTPSLGYAWLLLGFWPQFMGHKGEGRCRDLTYPVQPRPAPPRVWSQDAGN